MDKKLFLDSIRSIAAVEFSPEEAGKFDTLFGAVYDALRTDPGMQKKEVETMLAERLGDFGDEKTVAQRSAEMMQLIESMKKGEEQKPDFWSALRTAFEENKEAIKKTNNGGTVKLTMRTASTVTMSNIVAPKSLGARDSVVDAAPILPEFLPSQLITEVSLGEGSNPWVWMERAKKEGNPDYVTEGSDKPYMDFNWTEAEVTAKTIAAVVPISKVATWNYPSLEQEVRSDLMDELTNKYNDAIINGTGTAQLNGILGYYATELDLTGYTGGTKTKITNANFWDVILIAWQQSRKKVRGQRPDAILVSLDLESELDLQKTTDGAYVLPTWLINVDKTLKGVRIYGSEYISDRTVLVGSFPKAEFNMVKAPEIEVGWINDQFLKNQYALRAEFYGMMRVKAHKNNFIKVTDIDAARTAINAPQN